MAPKTKQQSKNEEKQVNAPEAGAVAQTSETALAKTAGSQLMNSAPDWLKAEMDGVKPRGFENVNTADIILPRLAIVQTTSPEFTNKDLDLELYDVFDSVSKQKLSPAGEALIVIVIVMTKTRLMFESPTPPSPVVCRSPDGMKATSKKGLGEDDQPTDDCEKCVYAKWSDDEKPRCTNFYNFLVLLPQFNFARYVVSYKSTGVKTARRWLSTMMHTGAHMYAGKYELVSKEETNGSQKWGAFDFKPMGWVTKEEYEVAKAQFATLDGKTWAPSEEGLDVEAAAESRSSGTGEKPAPF